MLSVTLARSCALRLRGASAGTGEGDLTAARAMRKVMEGRNKCKERNGYLLTLN